jgi:phage baseplate assembly protein W
MALVVQKTNTTPIKTQAEIFSDFFTDLDIHPVKKDFVRHTNEEAVKRSIKNLLLTNTGERFFNSDIGSDIRALLFEPMSPATEQILEDFIRVTIDNHEPRARIEQVQVLADQETQTVSATISFSVINKQEPVILELILNRIR